MSVCLYSLVQRSQQPRLWFRFIVHMKLLLKTCRFLKTEILKTFDWGLLQYILCYFWGYGIFNISMLILFFDQQEKSIEFLGYDAFFAHHFFRFPIIKSLQILQRLMLITCDWRFMSAFDVNIELLWIFKFTHWVGIRLSPPPFLKIWD